MARHPSRQRSSQYPTPKFRRNPYGSRSWGRRLRMETLEDRRLLAVFSVSNLDDAGTGSLRDAIDLANDTAGADEIQFS